MTWLVPNLWLIPALPMAAAGVIALTRQKHRSLASSLAIGAMSVSLVLSLCAFVQALSLRGEGAHLTFNINWVQFGSQWVQLGWMLDPLTAVMLVMVTFVGLLIFIYSTAYMHDDERFARFFCFLALFAGAMLGVVIANSLLLLFMCWEIMGLTSYLLIGFWFERPSAAAAAKKAFLVTRIGDLGLFLGMAWLYHSTGTLLFYNNGAGCVEHSAVAALVAHGTVWGLTAASAISILIFCGAAGKSGQVPLHVWLPDAMEGPTPVSAMIHAATMVASGVFLMARIYPLLAGDGTTINIALQVVTWTGAITAIFAATIAVAQNDIKRILAYSTVSQLGYMMMGIGVGGVSVGMFHLITHAFFKALLFLGAGSVIHGCSGEQDIRHMGGLRKYMPVTFAAYSAGMLALCGFPLFAGFWSKDAILHSAFGWSLSRVPFYLGAIGAILTAFYMTRQMLYVFYGSPRKHFTDAHIAHEPHDEHMPHTTGHARESPSAMTTPLLLLAVFAVLLGFIGTPAWEWFQAFVEGRTSEFSFSAFTHEGILPLMAVSTVLVFLGIGLGYLLYGRKPIASANQPDAIDAASPWIYRTLGNAFYIDAFYAATIVRLNTFAAHLADFFDRFVFNGIVMLVQYAALAVAWVNNGFDRGVVNGGFDAACSTVNVGGWFLSKFQTGRAQTYLRLLGVGFVVGLIVLLWGARG